MLTYQELPFVDEHGIEVDLPPESVWARLQETAPSTGFRVTESTPPAKLVLEGRHPFSRYALVFLIEPRAGGGACAVAQTWAAFPGVAGSVYRALVIGSGIHAVLVRRMLRRLR
jgi:hypothetical protein